MLPVLLQFSQLFTTSVHVVGTGRYPRGHVVKFNTMVAFGQSPEQASANGRHSHPQHLAPFASKFTVFAEPQSQPGTHGTFFAKDNPLWHTVPQVSEQSASFGRRSVAPA